LAKFRSILSIDPLAAPRRAAGVRNLAISPRRPPYGSITRRIPSSQIACTIGGNVAENAGGVHCLKYGLTVHNVRRVRGVLDHRRVVEFGGDALDSAATTCWR
jgi:glycolate oxidase